MEEAADLLHKHLCNPCAVAGALCGPGGDATRAAKRASLAAHCAGPGLKARPHERDLEEAERFQQQQSKRKLPQGWGEAFDDRTNRPHYWRKGHPPQWAHPSEPQADPPQPVPPRFNTGPWSNGELQRLNEALRQHAPQLFDDASDDFASTKTWERIQRHVRTRSLHACKGKMATQRRT